MRIWSCDSLAPKRQLSPHSDPTPLTDEVTQYICCAVGMAEAGVPGSGHDAHLDALTGLRLHSPLAWPLSPAVAEDALPAYNIVLAFLLQVRTGLAVCMRPAISDSVLCT